MTEPEVYLALEKVKDAEVILYGIHRLRTNLKLTDSILPDYIRVEMVIKGVAGSQTPTFVVANTTDKKILRDVVMTLAQRSLEREEQKLKDITL